MRRMFALVVLIHGLIHLLGFAKAFGLAELSALTQPIPRSMGLMWLVAAVAMSATSAVIATSPRSFWMIGPVAALFSQGVITSSWTDARVGTVVNVVILTLGALAFFVDGPFGLRREYEDAVEEVRAVAAPGPVLTEADVAPLPAALARYLRVSGAVGQPRVGSFRARWRGRIRGGPDEPWMTLAAEQVNTVAPAARLFWMDATMSGLPVSGLHAYRDRGATMRVLLGGLIPVVDAGGPEMTRAETVTLFNDLCVLAPSALASPAIRWEELASNRVRGTFSNAGHTVHAELTFGQDGMLTDFVSDDRARSVDGNRFEDARWSTPLSGARAFGPLRLASHGEGRWETPDGAFSYVELELVEFAVDPQPEAPLVGAPQPLSSGRPYGASAAPPTPSQARSTRG